jgi:hypothetical protein
MPPDPEATRLTHDMARDLKKRAHAAFGYVEGSRKLRQDLGLADDARLTLARLAKHTTAAQYQALIEAYSADLQASVEADVP